MDEFKPKSWGADPIDLAKEYTAWDNQETTIEDVPDKPEGFSMSLVRRGVIDPNTGLETGNSKQRHISRFTPSERFQNNYTQIFGHE